ncbi:MAG: PIG-L family deacetylase [Chloroflexi bacterium]|nr:PIG-L family deacetylase [Chloroflexota bacterium]
MVITAHPDDAEFTVAGTVARWVKEGWPVVYVICTDGSRGSNDPGMPPERMSPIRHAEQLEAARILGVQTVVFLDYEDGTLQPTLELRRDLTRLIRRYKPDIVICSDPTRYFHRDMYVNHPDHRAAGEAALYAIFPSAVTRFIFPELLEEGLEPHKVGEIYLYGSAEPNIWIDITDTIELKVAALKAHRSQVDPEYAEIRIREWNGQVGRQYGVSYAEEFRRIILR